MAHVAEMEDWEGDVVTVYSAKGFRYLSLTVAHAIAMRGQPKPQLVFHQPLQVLLEAGFDAGFVLDGLEERAFPPDHPARSNPLG